MAAAAILKTVKSPYLRNRLTDFEEIWHGDCWRRLNPYRDRPLKFRISNIQDGVSRYLQNHKSRDITAMNWPSSVNLARLFTRSSAITEGPRDASWQLKFCQLPRNSAETTCFCTVEQCATVCFLMSSPEEIEVMKLEGYSGAMCVKHVHSTMTRSSRFRCLIGVINKPTTDVLWISPVYRRLAVAMFSKSTI